MDAHTVDLSSDVSSKENRTHGASKVCGGAPCGFSDARTSSREARERSDSMWKLWGGVVLCFVFMGVEVFGGIKAHSLAILTDAAHLLSDVAAFAISLFAVWASGWEATPRQSYGFFRIEILGTLVSIQIIWLITGILVYEAIDRLIYRTVEIEGSLMFGIASFGLVVNLLMMFILGHGHGHGHGHDHGHDHGQHEHHHDHDHEEHSQPLLKTYSKDETKEKKRGNINVQGAYLHVLGDLIQSIGVMIGAAAIWYNPNLKFIDPICTLLFSVIVLYTTINMLRDILEVLMESTPREIDATSLERGLCEIDEVVAIHELHIWAITVGKVLLACHVRIGPGADADMVLDKVVGYINKEYNISHVTIQIERE
ncbi:putative cation efflux protein [Helianthus annuus]|nr:putative cation efflux protein [Helianthus annuus]